MPSTELISGDEMSSHGGYQIPVASEALKNQTVDALGGEMIDSEALPFIKPEDVSHFSSLLTEFDEEGMSTEEIRDRKIMMLLLKVKNGTPPMRKAALKTLTEKAREFGAGPLFNQILPLLMSPSLED
jgi:splicing factor 3B subunit 1